MSFYSSKLIKEPTQKKGSKKLLIFFLLLIAVASGYFIYSMPTVTNKIATYKCYWDSSIATKEFGANEIRSVNIKPGSNMLEIGKALQDSKIIPNSLNFACYVNKIEAGSSIQAGYYEIKTPITLEQLIPILKTAPTPILRVTIPEGLRKDQVAAKLDASFSKDNPIKKFSISEFNSLITDKSFISEYSFLGSKINNLEGFLFPDTYEFAKDATTKEVLDTLLKNFQKKVSKSTLFESKDIYSVVILASIIEKEAGKAYEEKQMISDVLQKRIEASYFLEVDATFLYEKMDWSAPITAEDKISSSKYNTYKRKGLPPTPICNPGYDSIAAVLDRKQNPYWFYLHGNDGKIRYGKTYEDHLQNIALYLR